MVRAAFLEIERTMSVRAMRTDNSNSRDFRLSMTIELSTWGSHVIIVGPNANLQLAGMQSIPRTGYTLFSLPTFKDFLLVEGQDIAIAVEHRLGTILRPFADQ